MSQVAENSHIPTVFDDEHQHVGEIYAKALIGAAKASGNADVVVQHLTSIVTDILNRSPVFESALSSPKLSSSEKMALMDKVFRGKVDPTLLNFLKVLCSRQRIGFIRGIQQAVVKMQDEAMGRLRVVVTTAVPLEEKQKTVLADTLRSRFGKDIALTSRTDPSLIGGMVIRIGDTVYDSSIHGRLLLQRKQVEERAEQQLRTKLDSLVS